MSGQPDRTIVHPNARAARRWFWGGFAFVAAAIGLLESLDPFFFCQDDALSLELPLVLQSCRSLWSGTIPTYDPFTFLGDPSPVVNGFYPPLYAAYAFARHVLHDEAATFDVFTPLHLMGGYCLTFVFARRLGVGPGLAVLAGASFVLSGPVVVMARCWHSFAAPAVFIPLFAVLVDRLRDGPVDWRWPTVTGLALGLFYHSGFPQLFVLGCGLLLVHAAALAVVGLVPWRRLEWLVPALAFGAAIAVPVFFQQWRLSRQIIGDDPPGGEGIAGNLLSMLLPYPLARGTLPNGWGNVNPAWNGHFYYSGTVLVAAFAAALGVIAWRWTGAATASGRMAMHHAGSVRLQVSLAIPAVIALLLALGEAGGLWWLMGLFPAGLRNNPFRAMPWLVFFASLAGARFLEDLLDAPLLSGGAAGASRRPRVEAAVAGAGLTLVVLHLTRVAIAFFVYGFTPYPHLPPELLAVIGPDTSGRQQRIMSFAAMRSSDPSYPLALPHNLPCVYEVPAVLGYNPLVERMHNVDDCIDRIVAQPRTALAAYGVRWLLVHRTLWGGWQPTSDNPFERFFVHAECLKDLDDCPQMPLPTLDDYLKVIEIPDAAPLAFDADRPAEALPLRMGRTGLDIDLAPEPRPRRVVANFLRYPDIVATADGRDVAVSEDEWHRLAADVPPGATAVRFRYRPPWATALALALVPAAAGAAALVACRRRPA